MKVFGLTGGIGCGKTTISKHWASQGLPIIDADLLSRRAVDPEYPKNVLCQLTTHFGLVVRPDGTLDRQKLGQIVFNDRKALRLLEEIMHPRMDDLFSYELALHRKAGHKLVCYDSAILIDKHDYPRHWSQFQPIVVVHISIDIQLKRLCERHPKLPKKEIAARVLAQMPGVRRLQFADYTIDNSGNVTDTLSRADAVLKVIKDSWT